MTKMLKSYLRLIPFILSRWRVNKSLYTINMVATYTYINIFHITPSEEKICLRRTGGDVHSLAFMHPLSLNTITSLAAIHLSETLFLMQMCNSFLEGQN